MAYLDVRQNLATSPRHSPITWRKILLTKKSMSVKDVELDEVDELLGPEI